MITSRTHAAAPFNKTLVGIACTVGVAARFFGLGYESLWFDELLSATAATTSSLSEAFHEHLVYHTHPPGYGVFLYIWAHTVGFSDVLLRLSSAIASAAALAVFYRLAKQQFSDEISSIATVLVALTYPGIYYSHECRPYAILMLLSTIATFQWLALVKSLLKRERTTSLNLAGYLAVLVLLSYTHYHGLAFACFQGLALLALAVRTRTQPLAFLGAAIALLLVYVPWIPMMTGMASSYSGSEGAGKPGIAFLLSFYSFLIVNKNLLAVLMGFCLFLLPVLLHPRSFYARVRSEAEPITLSGQNVLALLYLVAVPFASLMIVSQHTNIMAHRYLTFLCPASYLLMAHWIAWAIPRPSRACLLVLVVSLAGLSIEAPKYRRPHKEQWREAVDWAIKSSTPGDRFAAITFPELFEYYFRQLGCADMLAAAASEPALFEVLEDSKSVGARNVFVLRARGPALSLQTEHSLQAVSGNWERKEFRHATVYRFGLRPAGAEGAQPAADQPKPSSAQSTAGGSR